MTLDSRSGALVTGFSSCADSTDSGVRELRDELTAAMESGHERALLILDGGYQFAVSIGILCAQRKNHDQLVQTLLLTPR